MKHGLNTLPQGKKGNIRSAIALLAAAIVFGNTSIAQVNRTCTRTFTYTGTAQTFVVPDGITTLQVQVEGASGGMSAAYDGSAYGYPGLGGKVEATIPVTPGEVLTLIVGGAGRKASHSAAGTGGYNGGADGGAYQNTYIGGGGGGASDIRFGNATLNDRIIVAGGGGASGYFGAGGNGGDINGAEGYGADANAGGGSQNAGGAGGSYSSMFYSGSGSFGLGGNGGEHKQGGGGGGGWYGGGGGAFGDGGGGSSYVIPSATNITHTQGEHTGNGKIKIMWCQQVNIKSTGLHAAASSNAERMANQPTVSVNLYPNPTTGNFTVQMNNERSTKAEVTIVGQNGATVQQNTIELASAKQTLHFNLENKPAGIYLVRVSTIEGVQTSKIFLHK